MDFLMAVGDVINYISPSGAGTFVYYQPAAGVEIMVTATVGISSGRYRLYNGAINAEQVWTTGTTSGNAVSQSTTKIGITNSIYLGIWADSGAPGFTGIQIK
tara:strand:+ start:54 stop:359 length:306 start_codon:yes stop_codon:yes gene_type:complete